MSGYKRRDAYRKNGKPYRPRNIWKQEQPMKHIKRSAKKPFRLQFKNTKVKDFDVFDEMFYGTGEWKDDYKSYKKLQDGIEAIKQLKRNYSHNKHLIYRIVKDGEVLYTENEDKL